MKYNGKLKNGQWENFDIERLINNQSRGRYFRLKNEILVLFGNPCYQGERLEAILPKVTVKINWIENYISEINGHFLIIYLNIKSINFKVYTDKSSSLSFYYYQDNKSFYFSSHILDLYKFWSNGRSPEIRKEAIYEFLGSGHLWGEKTFWKNVERLGPGLKLTLNKFFLKKEKYWQFDINNNHKVVEEDLNNAIKNDIEQLPRKKSVLTLSGGYDSRALLGYLDQSDIDFDVITYSFGDKYEEKYDDDIAIYFAKKTGRNIKFHNVNLSASRIIGDIQTAIEITGGESDTSLAQDAILGSEFYSRLAQDYEYVIRGDEAWGGGDLVINNQTAFWQSLLLNIDQLPYLKDLMDSEVYNDGVNYINKFKVETVQYTSNFINSSNQLKDYLYWFNRLPRLIHNMASYRRHYLDHYAPFIFGHALGVINHTSESQRVNKNLFKKTAAKEFPNLFNDKNQPSKKKPFKSRFEILFENEEFKSYLLHSLIEEPNDFLREIFEADQFFNWIHSVVNKLDNSSSDISKSTYNTLRGIYDLFRKNNHVIALMTLLYVDIIKGKFPAMDYNLLFRIFVLNETLKKY